MKRRGHTNIEFSGWLTEHITFQIAVCVCHPCAVCNNKAEPLFTCKNMRVTCCSCRLKVSLLKQNKHTRNHCWLNPQLPQSHHYPNAPRGGTQRTHATQEGVLLEAAFSFFFGRGKIKFHQRAELQHLRHAFGSPCQTACSTRTPDGSELKSRPTLRPSLPLPRQLLAAAT